MTPLWRPAARSVLAILVILAPAPAAAQADDISTIQARCEEKDLASCVDAAAKHQFGVLVPQSTAKAAVYYGMACDGGLADACVQLGGMYDLDKEQANPEAAVAAFRKGCEAGAPEGCFQLGVKLVTGRGVAANQPEAARYLRKGCEGGSAGGCSVLGVMYEKGSAVSPEPEAALVAHERACAGQIEESCKRRLPAAKSACEAGRPAACAAFFKYESGKEAAPDTFAALVPFYRDTCGRLVFRSCTSLGVMHALGWGTAQDHRAAATSYRKACEGGDVLGCSLLGEAHANGWGVARSYREAVSHLKKACDGGAAGACLAAVRYAHREPGAADTTQTLDVRDLPRALVLKGSRDRWAVERKDNTNNRVSESMDRLLRGQEEESGKRRVTTFLSRDRPSLPLLTFKLVREWAESCEEFQSGWDDVEWAVGPGWLPAPWYSTAWLKKDGHGVQLCLDGPSEYGPLFLTVAYGGRIGKSPDEDFVNSMKPMLEALARAVGATPPDDAPPPTPPEAEREEEEPEAENHDTTISGGLFLRGAQATSDGRPSANGLLVGLDSNSWPKVDEMVGVASLGAELGWLSGGFAFDARLSFGAARGLGRAALAALVGVGTDAVGLGSGGETFHLPLGAYVLAELRARIQLGDAVSIEARAAVHPRTGIDETRLEARVGWGKNESTTWLGGRLTDYSGESFSPGRVASVMLGWSN